MGANLLDLIFLYWFSSNDMIRSLHNDDDTRDHDYDDGHDNEDDEDDYDEAY